MADTTAKQHKDKEAMRIVPERQKEHKGKMIQRIQKQKDI